MNSASAGLASGFIFISGLAIMLAARGRVSHLGFQLLRQRPHREVGSSSIYDDNVIMVFGTERRPYERRARQSGIIAHAFLGVMQSRLG